MLSSFSTIKPLRAKPVELGVTLILCLLTGMAIALSSDLKLPYRLAMGVAFFSSTAFFVLPHKKLMLIIAWFFVHPLSIEKVFQIGSPLLPGFAAPTLVISGSDIILAALGMVLLFESLILHRRNVWSFPKAMTPLLLFVVWNFTVFMIKPTSTSSMLAMIHISKMVFFVLIMVSAISTEKYYKIALGAIAVAVGIQVILVCYSAFSGDILRFSSKITNSVMSFSGAEAGQSHIRATGSVGHVNQEASFLTFFALPLLGLPLLTSRFKSLFIWLILGGATVAIVLTFSRSAWLAISFALAILMSLAFYYKLLPKKIWANLFPFILVGIIAFPVLSPPLIDRLIHGDDGATSSRIRAINLALDLTQKHPVIGVGPGNFAKASLDYYPPHQITESMRSASSKPKELAHRFGRLEVSQVHLGSKIISFPLPVHNKFLLVLCELGIIGLLLFLWFQWRIFQHIHQTILKTYGAAKWAPIGLMAAFGASLVYMNLDLFADDKTTQILLIIPILAMALNKISVQENTE